MSSRYQRSHNDEEKVPILTAFVYDYHHIGNLPKHPLPYPYMIYVDNAVITAQDKQFFEGFQHGYADFLMGYQGKILSDQDIYALTMTIVDVQHTATHQAGFITGWMTAMLEPVAGDTKCKLIEIVQE